MKFMYLCTAFMSTQPLHNLFHSDLIKNSGKLLSANVIAQAISLLIYPVLTRIYSQADFGLLNLFSSIAGVALIVCTGKYQDAIPLEKEDKSASAVFHVGFFFLLSVSAILILFLPFSSSIANLFNAPALSSFLWLVPVFVFCSGIWQLLLFWYTRKKNFTSISTYQVTNSLFSASGKWGLNYLIHAGGLIYATVIAPFLSLAINIIYRWKSLKPLCVINLQQCSYVAKKYRNFPLFTTPRALVNTLSNSLPMLLLTPMFGLQQVGLWGMALTLSFIPINIIANSMYQIFFQHTSHQVNDKQPVKYFLNKYLLLTSLFALLLFVPLYFCLPSLTAWLLGADWETTGHYIRWMLPWLFVTLLTSPHGYIPDLFFQQKKELLFEILLFIIRLSALLIGMFFHDFIMSIAGYCLAGFAVKTILLIWYMYLINNYEKQI